MRSRKNSAMAAVEASSTQRGRERRPWRRKSSTESAANGM